MVVAKDSMMGEMTDNLSVMLKDTLMDIPMVHLMAMYLESMKAGLMELLSPLGYGCHFQSTVLVQRHCH